MIRSHQPDILINDRLPKPKAGGDWGFPTPEQRLGVYSDQQLIDELYFRIERGSINLDLLHAGRDSEFARILVYKGKAGGEDRYGFETMAYAPVIAHI